MSRSTRRKAFETAALVAALVAASTAFNAAASIEGSPWTRVISGDAGEIVAAYGVAARGVPLFMTVANTRSGNRLVSTTTFVRGRHVLRIERIIDPIYGLKVNYMTRNETVSLHFETDPSTSDSVVVYTLPDGQTRTLWLNAERKTVIGDVAAIQKELAERSHILPLLREFDRQSGKIRSTLSRTGDKFMLRWPDGPCLDSCGAGCRLQCGIECTIEPTCTICMAACGAGCLIGCSS